jgi:hypothetical protein
MKATRPFELTSAYPQQRRESRHFGTVALDQRTNRRENGETCTAFSNWVSHPFFTVARHEPVRFSNASSLRRSRSPAQLNTGSRQAIRSGHETKRRFMALAVKADHFCNESRSVMPRASKSHRLCVQQPTLAQPSKFIATGQNPRSPQRQAVRRGRLAFSGPRRMRLVARQRLSHLARACLVSSSADRLMSRGSRRARSHSSSIREPRSCSILNLSILVSAECTEPMNLCAMVRSISL